MSHSGIPQGCHKVYGSFILPLPPERPSILSGSASISGRHSGKSGGYPSHSIRGKSPNSADSYLLAIGFVVSPGFEEDMQYTMLARKKRRMVC